MVTVIFGPRVEFENERRSNNDKNLVVREDVKSMTLSMMYISVMKKLHEICLGVGNIRRAQKIDEGRTEQILQLQRQLIEATDKNTKALAQIILFLQPPPPVKFIVEFMGENAMAKVVKATVDFQMLDNGTAVATLTPVDVVGNVTTMPDGASVPAWASSDPAVVVAAAADGLSATLTPSGSLATGVLVSASSTLSDGTTISGQGDPIDVVAGPASSFKIVEQ